MTPLDVILAIAGGIGIAFQCGWWAGARWRRAHDAARYAQIEARRLNARMLKTEELARARHSAVVTVDWNFAASAFQHAGYDVTPTLKPAEKH